MFHVTRLDEVLLISVYDFVGSILSEKDNTEEAFLVLTISNLTIRAETPTDYSQIRALIISVFHETYGSGEAEAALVEQLRKDVEGAPTIALVAEQDGVVLGYVLFSRVYLQEHPTVAACALAPLGVYRQYQHQGIGTRLVQRGLAECTAHGFHVLFVQGSLEYYARFGFLPIAGTQLKTVFHSDHDMVLALDPCGLQGLRGLVTYPKSWNQFIS